MGQYWRLINLDKRQAWPPYLGFKLGEQLFSRYYNGLPLLLARPSGAKIVIETELDQDVTGDTLCDDMKKASLTDEVKAQHPTVSRSNAPGTIGGLPVEILVVIFDHITDFNDMASLSLANKTLWLVGYRCIQMRNAREFPQWAGDRLICVGDYALASGLPEDVFTEDELEEFRLTIKGENRNEDDDEFRWARVPLGDVLVYNEWQWVTIRSQRFYRWDETFLHDQLRCPSNDLMKTLFDHLNLAEMLYDATQEWVLCNLTKCEFIRAAAIAQLTGTKNAKGPFIGKGMTLGQVLIAHIAWSDDPSVAMMIGYEPGSDIHRGRWAGDRFEITTTDRVKNLVEEWKDISDEAAKRMETIWEAEFDEEWRVRT
ncbi:hypothetical protein QCA50_008189 [Cerrena zonata]|uniref:F-box domain-containing protein n=1 Tax=Cerrena zonata TaxID=2478898 RepID=A0AAW0GGP8_9APHY